MTRALLFLPLWAIFLTGLGCLALVLLVDAAVRRGEEVRRGS